MTPTETTEYRQEVRKAILSGTVTQPIPQTVRGFHPSVHWCDCGQPATHKDPSGWECDRCHAMNLLVDHPVDHATYDPEFEAQRLETRRLAYKRAWQRVKARRAKETEHQLAEAV